MQYPDLSSSGLGSQVVGGHPIEGRADDWNLAAVRYRSPNQNQEFICGDNHFWVVCSTPNKNKIARADSTVYRCIVDNYGIGEWTKIGDDKDNDGYISTIDDKDDGTPATGCPTLSDEELQNLKTVEEIRSAMLNKCNEDRVKYSACSSCKNPAAPEVCGDTVDNDGKEETKDNCNENREACIQEGNSLNIYNEKFAYTDGFCCGYGGVYFDLGKTSGKYLCLKEDKELVGWEGSFPRAQSLCGDKWCLVPSTDANTQFKVFTARKPFEEKNAASFIN